MKIKLVTLLTMVTFILVSCSETESDEFCSNPDATCPSDGAAITATSCCTDQDCYWLYDNTKYDCDGDDCDAAIASIIASACVTAYAGFDIDIDTKDYALLKAQMQSVTDKLLLEARGASGCD